MVEFAIAAVRRFLASDCAALSSPFLVYSENCGMAIAARDADDGDDDHQLDQGETLLQLFHEIGLLHGECNGRSVE